MSTISIKIDVANLMEVAENLVAFRTTLTNGGFGAAEASSIAANVIDKAMEAGRTTVSIGTLDDQQAFLAKTKLEVRDYVIEQVATFMSRPRSPEKS